MFSLDTPPETPIILAQAQVTATVPGLPPDFLFEVCKETESSVDETLRPGEPGSAMRAIDPAGMLEVYLKNYGIRKEVDVAAIKTTLIEGTKHGVIIEGHTKELSKGPSSINYKSRTVYSYDAVPDYEGHDRVVFMAEYEGKRYKIIIDLRVFKMVNEYEPTCPEPQLIKVNKPRASFIPETTGNQGLATQQLSPTTSMLPAHNAVPGNRSYLINPYPAISFPRPALETATSFPAAAMGRWQMR